MSYRAVLNVQGQVTIPQEIRDRLSLKTGDQMTLTLMSDATVIMRVKTKRVGELAGLLHMIGRKTVPVRKLSR